MPEEASQDLVRHDAETARNDLDGELVVLAVSKDQVKDAPDIDEDAHISKS